MKDESLYLDTSVPSAYFDDNTKERQEATKEFWRFRLPTYEIYISEITLDELRDTKDDILRKKLLESIQDFKVLKTNSKIRNLAKLYLDEEVFPKRYSDDALHVAIASYFKLSFLVSWNFQHLVKVKTRRLVNSINSLHGFQEIEIISPLEL